MNADSLTEANQLRHLKIQIQRRLKYCLQLAEQYFSHDFRMPAFDFQIRGLKAGIAYLEKNQISLNKILLLENSDLFIEQVVPHELAHLIVYQRFGKVRPHGKEWQLVMEKVFNLPAKIYHDISTHNVIGKVFRYQCACRMHLLSSRRHNSIQTKNKLYVCRDCKQPLSYIQ